MNIYDNAQTFSPRICSGCQKEIVKGDGWWEPTTGDTRHYDCTQPKLKKNLKAEPEREHGQGGTRYGSPDAPGLRILGYLLPKATQKDPALLQHTWLVGATNGTPGTAFLRVNLKNAWLKDIGIHALAFGLPGDSVPADTVKAARDRLMDEAVQRVSATNTPSERMEEAIEKAYKDILTQVRINVGSVVLHLQDWKGVERNPDCDFAGFAGTEFSAVVYSRTWEGKEQSEIKTVLKPRRKAVTPPAESEPKATPAESEDDVPF